MNKPDVSIIVACRNERRHIELFVSSLLAQQTPGMTVEVLVADGRSDDGTREILESLVTRAPSLRMLDNEARIVSTGLNAAIRAARGDIVLRMDAHTEYAPDYVARCVDLLRATGCDNVGGPARTRASGYTGRAIAAAYHSPFACGGSRFHLVEYEGEADTVPYGCWPRELLLRIGGFDEKLVRNQDDELNLRIVRAGGRIWQSPSIRSWYHPRSSLKALFHQYFQYGFWKVAVIRKHSVPASWRHLVPGLFVLTLMALACAAVAFAVAGAPDAAVGATSLLGFAAALYALASCAAALLSARHAGWDVVPALPLVFAVYHVSYGTGFLFGSLWWPFRSREAAERQPFSTLSR